MHTERTPRPWTDIAARLAAFAGLWLIIAGNDPRAWLIGAPAALMATWASAHLATRHRWQLSPLGAVRFLGFFLLESLRGGLDVAVRVFSPGLRISPGFSTYDCRLPAGLPRTLFTSCICLLPGSLPAELQDDRLWVHRLDAASPLQEQLGRLECVIARMFALDLDTGALPK